MRGFCRIFVTIRCDLSTLLTTHARADGSEDVEFVSVVDVLRRAGIKVIAASVMPSTRVTLANGVVIEADTLLSDVKEEETFDVIVLPGGLKGSDNFRDSSRLIDFLRKQKDAGRWVAAICAAPAVVLQARGLLQGVKAVAYPSFMKDIKDQGTGRVCVDKNFITSIGPGSALEFALAIVEQVVGAHTKKSLTQGMCIA